MFCCPNCKGLTVIADDPGAYVVYSYDDEGQQITDCQSYSGHTIMNTRCSECEHPFNEDEWRNHSLEKQHAQ